MVYRSSEAALHNRENLFDFDTGLFVLHQLKYLDVLIRLRLKEKKNKTLFEAYSYISV